MGGPGTADAHWRELVFDNELMTGFVNFGTNPLSGITVASLADVGYAVNLAGADPYSIPAPIRLRAGPSRPAVSLGKDVLILPIGVVGTSGDVLDVIRP